MFFWERPLGRLLLASRAVGPIQNSGLWRAESSTRVGAIRLHRYNRLSSQYQSLEPSRAVVAFKNHGALRGEPYPSADAVDVRRVGAGTSMEPANRRKGGEVLRGPTCGG